MIIIKLQGGLGNQLYQYALYKKLNRLGKEVYLDDIAYRERGKSKEFRNIELTSLNGVTYEACTDEMRTRLLDDRLDLISKVRRKLFGRKKRQIIDMEEYMPEIFDVDDYYLEGYWQNQMYFKEILPELQNELFYEAIDCHLADKILSDNSSVSLHIRLSDYTTLARKYGGIATKEYYLRAIDRIKAQKGKINIYLFSDDINEAKRITDEWGLDCIEADSKSICGDMMLQSMCKNNICANSSFSMWAAMLNKNSDKICVRPLKLNNETIEAAEIVKAQWFDWIIIDEAGKVIE